MRTAIGRDIRDKGAQHFSSCLVPEGTIFGHIRVVIAGVVGAGGVVAGGLPALCPLLVGGGGGGQGTYGRVELFPCGRDPRRAGQVGVDGGHRLRVTADEVAHGPGRGADGRIAGGQVRLTPFTWRGMIYSLVVYPKRWTLNSDRSTRSSERVGVLLKDALQGRLWTFGIEPSTFKLGVE